MKTLVVSLTLVSVVFGCTNLKYLEAFNGYKGKPGVIESTTYTILKTDTVTTEKAAYTNVFHFDRKGRKLKHLMYKADGSPANGGWNYVYDKAGNIVQNTLHNLDGGVIVRNRYSYNKHGQQIFREHVAGGRRTVTKTVYDRRRRVAVTEGFTNDTVFHEKTVHSYDDNWRETELRSFTSNGLPERRMEKVYDGSGNLVLTRWYDAAGRLYEFYKTEFDDRKNRTKIEHYRVNGSDTTLVGTTQMQYVYDDRGNMISETLISNGRLTSVTRHRFHYPEKNN